MHAHTVANILALASSAYAGALPSPSSTSTVTLYSTATQSTDPECTFCPKEYDRNWENDRVLNDTRKHHSSFKLFAYPKGSDEGWPLHVISHPEREGMWNLHIGQSDPAENVQSFQPKWNLHERRLQTDGSKPGPDTLYFHLYDAKYPKDTEFWTGIVYHDVVTKYHNKKTYHREHDAKLVASKGWSLVRENDDPSAYLLKGSKPAGDFFLCLDVPNPADVDPSNLPNGEDLMTPVSKAFQNGRIVYASGPENLKEGFAISTNGNTFVGKKGCVPLDIKAQDWTNTKQGFMPAQ